MKISVWSVSIHRGEKNKKKTKKQKVPSQPKKETKKKTAQTNKLPFDTQVLAGCCS
jgi:hypothetical protein